MSTNLNVYNPLIIDTDKSKNFFLNLSKKISWKYLSDFDDNKKIYSNFRIFENK